MMVESIDKIPTTEINISDMENSVTIDAFPVNQNSLISLDDQKDIKVTVNIVQSKTQKTFDNIKITYENLPLDFEITSKTQLASVSVTGTVLDMEKTQVSDISLQADCNGITNSGEYELPVNVVIPSVLSLDSVSVEKIKVNVIEKEDDSSEETEKKSRDSAFENIMQKQ